MPVVVEAHGAVDACVNAVERQVDCECLTEFGRSVSRVIAPTTTQHHQLDAV
jgi:hypothetical protein